MMYKLNEFMIDVSPVLDFKILRALDEAGYPAQTRGNYTQTGPQLTRRCFMMAYQEAEQLINAGLPATAFVQDIYEFLTRRFDVQNPDTPEIMNQKNVVACVNKIMVLVNGS